MKNSKTSVRTLVMLALLTAMSIVFARVFTISTGFVRFNLGALPTHLAAVWFGPAGGFAVGALADMIGGTLSGYSINPLITLGAGSVGLVSGLLFRQLSQLRLGLRLQLSITAGHVVGSVIINSIALHLFYGYAWPVLAARIPNALILSAVNTVLVRLLLQNKSLREIVQ
ncbi:MAG: folate family ECF transporter S component [Ruminococcaceae bacterium]|nr:folate family ECF transporter S component [Oscillospiraceae bacterium]